MKRPEMKGPRRQQILHFKTMHPICPCAPQCGNAQHTTARVARHSSTIGQRGGRGERRIDQCELEAIGGQVRADAIRPLDERHVVRERGGEFERRALVDGADAVEVEVVDSVPCGGSESAEIVHAT